MRRRVSGSVTTTIRRPWENPALGAQTTAASAIRSSTSRGTGRSAYVRTLRRRVRTSRKSMAAEGYALGTESLRLALGSDPTAARQALWR
jgi:hypothetical protein